MTIPNKANFRDLGSHLNFTQTNNGKTLTDRMNKAAKDAYKVGWIVKNPNMAERVVQANVLAAALYGAETTHVNKQALNKLRSAVAFAIGPKSKKRNVDLAFEVTKTSKDLDPHTHIIYNRVINARRMIAKNDSYKNIIADIIIQYGTKPKASIGIKNIWENVINEENEEMTDAKRHGPIGLLIDSLHEIDMEIDSNLDITSVSTKMSFNLCDIPWNHIKNIIFHQASIHRCQQIGKDRTFCGSITEIEGGVLKSVVNNLNDREKNSFCHISTEGFWHDGQLKEIGITDGKCSHCGKNDVDHTHILWDCPCINEKRINNKLSSINTAHLPTAIKCGLPIAMSAKINGNFWIEQEGDSKHIINGNIKDENKATSQDYDINQCLASNDNLSGNDNAKIAARHVFNTIKGQIKGADLIIPNRCLVQAPTEINVYTDGSWINPMKQYLGLGGAGVWWPGRTLDNNNQQMQDASYWKHLPISDSENQMCYWEQQPKGVALYTKVGGYSGSSTRTEVAAGIIAILADGPIHIGTDSKAFATKANKLILFLEKGKGRKPNFKLRSDGDLWEHFYKSVQAKGTTAVKISWVKGHATDEHIANGITTLNDKEGNFKADQSADVGVGLHGENLVKIIGYFHDKYQKYVNFMKDVSHHIIDAYIIHRQLKEKDDSILAEQERVNKHVSYKPLSYLDDNKYEEISNHANINNYKQFHKKNPKAKTVQKFLSNLKVTNDQGYRPTTWIEIYVLYRLRGYARIIDPPSQPTGKKPTADKQIRALINLIRAMSIRTLDQQAKDAFRPGKSTKDNMIGLGIKGTIPVLSCNVYANTHEREQIDKQFVKLARSISDKKLNKFIDGSNGVIARQLALNSQIQWDQKIPNVCRTMQDTQDQWEVPDDTTKFVEDVCYYTCPSIDCNKVKPNYLKCFQRNNLDNITKCTFCKRKSLAYTWVCQCGKKWHTCVEHGKGHDPTIMPITKKPKAKAKPKIKPSLPKRDKPATHEQITEHESRLKIARSEPPANVASGSGENATGAMTKMGPNIAKRFGYLLNKEKQ